jgi:putative flippase GtrA
MKIDRTLFKFILVGIVNTILGSAVMFLLYNLAGFGYWLSSSLNYMVGSICGLFLNKYFTFGIKYWSVKMVVAYFVTIIVSYIAAFGIAKPAVSYILREYNLKILGNSSLLVGMCLYTLLNYAGQRIVVFKPIKNT